MASGITHILLMKHLQEYLPDGNLKLDLAEGRDFLQAGAVGPDLPYASIADDDWFFSTESGLADSFHYERTNQIALKAFKMIRERQADLTSDEQLYLFCFHYVLLNCAQLTNPHFGKLQGTLDNVPLSQAPRLGSWLLVLGR